MRPQTLPSCPRRAGVHVRSKFIVSAAGSPPVRQRRLRRVFSQALISKGARAGALLAADVHLPAPDKRRRAIAESLK